MPVMDMRILGLGACAIVAAAIVARIFWMFANRVPVLAQSMNTDALGETMPGDPLNPPEAPHGIERMSPFHTSDMRLDYEVGGKHYKHDVEARSIDGLAITAPDDKPILWVDPANPLRLERHGPGFWFIALIVVGFAATAILQYS
jgi:hypothetical protein